ncbi:hypothetical protein [Sanguibacter suaedae]|uniref:Uncharacterized protein n=1 Tax=Sanguibacter suaedae TaxID=2795737 RepID=A0A934I7I8_9MICO|nr:hypothetical protein [Sanguibacter suaedae]MBI9113422.1 hypothetical protein [Sanguibacter suaedae]
MEEHVVEEQPEVVDEAVDAIHERDRDGDAPVLDQLVGEVAWRLLTSCPARGSSLTLRAAQELDRRGDRAGARLLLRAVARVAPDQALHDAERRLRPPGAVRRRVKVVASIALTISLLVGGAMAAVVAGAEDVALVLMGATHGPVLVARIMWVQRVRLPGLTLQESRFWRSLGVLRPGDASDLPELGDGRLRRATTDLKSPRAQRRPSDAEKPDVSGWIGLAGVIGAVLGPVCGLAIPGLTPGGFLALMPVGAVVAALAIWAVLRSRANDADRHPSSRHDHSR